MKVQTTGQAPAPRTGRRRNTGFRFGGGIGGWYPDRRPEGPGDARQQFTDALGIMKEGLVKSGMTMANVLKIKVSLVDSARNWPAVYQVYQEQFPEPRPVITCFGVTGFRRGPGQLLQVESIAYTD